MVNDEKESRAVSPLGQRSFHAPEHDAEKMAESEYMLVLESMMGPGSQLCQHSPLARPEALHSLDLLARFHAWGWSPDAARAELMASQLVLDSVQMQQRCAEFMWCCVHSGTKSLPAASARAASSAAAA